MHIYEIFHSTVKTIGGKDFFLFVFKKPFKFQVNFYLGMLLGLYFYYCFKFYFIYLFFIQQVLISYLLYTHQCIHVNPNRPIHHTTPPNPCFPPLVSIRLFSTSLSLFLPCKPVHLYHFSRFHVFVLIYDICFSLSGLLHSV